MKVALVGMPGAGKTHFGEQLSKYLDIPFVDLDQKIETLSSCSIVDWFGTKGEEAFREYEAQTLKDFLDSSKNEHDWILATGGGTPCFKGNLKLLQNHCITVYLKQNVDTLATRIYSKPNKRARPLLPEKSLEAIRTRLTELVRQRRQFYEQTHIITDFSSAPTPHLFTKRLDLFTDCD